MRLRRGLSIFKTALKAGILRRAPSLYPLFSIRPTSCNIMITNKCNLKCIMCKQWKRQREEELTVADWKRIIIDLKHNGIRDIHFTGGEPLLRAEDLLELIRYCRDYGMSCGMTTNGALLEKGMLVSLIKSGLSSMALSIDAIGSAYDDIRGVPRLFAKIRESAELIAYMRNRSKLSAYINFVLMKKTIDEFDSVKRFADELELPVGICLLDKSSIQFGTEDNEKVFWISNAEDHLRLDNLLRAFSKIIAQNPSSLLMTMAMVDFIRGYFHDPRQAHILCVSSQDRIIIDPSGNFFGGCLSMGSFGNIAKRSFSQLRSDDQYKRAKRNMLYKKCSGCSCGYQFNIICSPDLAVRSIIGKILMSMGGKCQ